MATTRKEILKRIRQTLKHSVKINDLLRPGMGGKKKVKETPKGKK